jgi:hypothetical protein
VSVADLIVELQRVADGEALPLAGIPADSHSGYWLGISHTTHADLVRKANLALGLLHAEAKTNR